MKLSAFLKNWTSVKLADKKTLSIEMSSRQSIGLSVEPQSAVSPRNYRHPIAKACYLLSFAVGTIGTYFTLRSQTTDDTDMPSRVLYSLTLMSAGLLLEVARVAASDESTEPASHSKVPDTQESVEMDTLITEEKEDKTDITLTLDLKQTVNQPLSPRPSSPSSGADLPFSPAESTPVTKNDRANTITKPFTGLNSPPPTKFWQWFPIGLNALSVTWFGQTFSLFVRNAIVESSSSHLLPYTTLVGLATGYLFHVCLKPWRLWGLRDWIVNNRNTFTGMECVIFFFLPPVIGQDLSLYYYTISAFWSGFNLNDGIGFIINKLITKKLPLKITDEIFIDREVQLHIPYSYWRNGFPITATGGVLITGAILLLQLVTDDNTGLRNIFAILFSAIGCYLLTYPLGVILGRKIPPRYYNDMLELCTYLLVPLASPNLSILHLLAMTGAGVCGGIAHDIFEGRYQKKLTMMHRQLEEIEKQLVTFPVLVEQLLKLPLPKDWFLVDTQKKNIKYMLIARSTYPVVFICALATQLLWKNPSVTIGAVMSLLLLPVMTSFVLPKYAPSIYKIHQLSWLPHFLYSDSFSAIYMVKVMMFVNLQYIYGVHGNFLLSQKTTSPDTIFSMNFSYLLYAIFSMKAGYILSQGGYIPYFPSHQEIKKLMLLTQPEKIKLHLKNVSDYKNQPIALNYHLLQFMKHNLKFTTEHKIDTTNNTEQKERKTNLENPCPHPLSQLNLFSVVHHLPTHANHNNEIRSLPLATVHCEDCAQEVIQINSEWDQRSQRYIKTRFDVSLYSRSADAIIRGNALARQFTFGLPAGLGLAEGVKSFSI